jgi:hypothetical protein
MGVALGTPIGGNGGNQQTGKIVREHYAAAVELVSAAGCGCQARLCEQLGVTSQGAAYLVIRDAVGWRAGAGARF